MSVEYGSYNGHPTLLIKSDHGTPVSLIFGFRKAKLILENIEEIKKFVEKSDNSSLNIKFHEK